MLGVTRQEIALAIESFESETSFAILFSAKPRDINNRDSDQDNDQNRDGRDEGPAVFPASGEPTRASPAQKARALQFLAKTLPAAKAKVARDLITAVRMAQTLDVSQRILVYFGDGELHDDEPLRVLDAIDRWNHDGIRIHVVGLGPDRENEPFLRQLAERNGGTYRQMDL